jgi:hypothetical protein
MKPVKYLLLFYFGITLFISTGHIFFSREVLEKTVNDSKNEVCVKKDETEQELSISIAEYYWKEEIPYNDILEENIPDVIEATNSYISNKIGEEFFDKYFHYYPYLSRISNSGEIYYLDYIVLIPEKDIDYKTTTHPVLVDIKISKDYELLDPSQIEELPDCSSPNDCLKYLDRERAMNTIQNDMEIKGYIDEEILFDWDIYALQYHLRYDLPCGFIDCSFPEIVGSSVSIYYDAFKDEVIERDEYFNHIGT